MQIETMIRLAIIEDNITYQAALQAFVSTMPDVEIVYVSAGLDDMAQLIAAMPDVVIMDIDLGHQSGIEGVKKIKATLPKTGVLMLTVFEDEEKIFASINAGAVGYLLKKDPPQKIIEAVRNIHRGEGAINGMVARKVLQQFAQPANRVPKIDHYNLTKREKEILLLLIEGLSYKEIAAQCFVSIDTINSHIRNIYSKLGIHTRSEIAARLR